MGVGNRLDFQPPHLFIEANDRCSPLDRFKVGKALLNFDLGWQEVARALRDGLTYS